MNKTADVSKLTLIKWEVIKANNINALGLDFSLTANPTLILMKREFFQPVKSRPPLFEEENLDSFRQAKASQLSDQTALSNLYSEFAEEELELAHIGVEHYINLIEQEENN